MVQIPELVEQANKENWAIDASEIVCVRKIGSGGFGVGATPSPCSLRAAATLRAIDCR